MKRTEGLPHLLEQCYRRALGFYPVEFRDEYGTEMVEFFRDECRRAERRAGLAGLLFAALRTLTDLIRTAPGAHMDILRQDLRFGLRTLRKSPGFTVTAIVALALGIGANSTIFSLVHGILIAPLPFPEPDRLVALWENNPRGIERNSVSPPNFVDYRASARCVAGLAAFFETSIDLTGADEPEHVAGAVVTPGFFAVLGIDPAIGTDLRAGESQVVVSHWLWQRRFHGDFGAIGKTLRIDEKSYRVAGVMPEGFQFFSPEVELWMAMPAAYFQSSRQAHFLSVVGRLKEGTTVAQARAEFNALAAGLSNAYPASNRGWGATVVPLKEQIVGDIRKPLLVLLGAVGFVLLIACANIANLLLARSAHRHGEMAVRTALGAGRGRLGRQMLSESILLALFGGAAGLLLSFGLLGMLRALEPAAVPRLEEVGVDGWVLAFTFAITLLTGAVAGVAPALRFARADLTEALKEGSALRPGFSGHRLRGLLLHGEIALSLLLLTGAGLLIRSFVRLANVDAGFHAEAVATFKMDLPASRYRSAASRVSLLEEALVRLRGLRGAGPAGMISSLPLTGGEGYNRFGFTIDAREDTTAAETGRFYARWITPGYLGSMRIPLLRGRDFSERDRAGSAPVVIIDAGLARRYFRNTNPLGKLLRLSYSKSTPREVVGVAGEVRGVAMEMEPAPHIYIPVFQEAQLSTISVTIRGSDHGVPTAQAVREELHRLDRNLPVYDFQPMIRRLRDSVAPRRLNMALMTGLAGMALILACIGLYGVVSYVTRERVHEIGIRMALGARPAGILWLVVRQGMKHALVGMAGGLAGSLLLTRTMAGLLFGISPTDGWTLASVTAVTAVVTLLACLAPAARASRLSPLGALRSGWGRS